MCACMCVFLTFLDPNDEKFWHRDQYNGGQSLKDLKNHTTYLEIYENDPAEILEAVSVGNES